MESANTSCLRLNLARYTVGRGFFGFAATGLFYFAMENLVRSYQQFGNKLLNM
jgi:hypothetical protein